MNNSGSNLNIELVIYPYTTVSIKLLTPPPKPLLWMANKTPAKGNNLAPRYRIREVFYVPL